MFSENLYLFPMIFTAGNMFCGLLSIILSIKGNFSKASWLIILGILFDGADGLIAKLKKASSSVGVELDSFADFVTFCIAPMVLVWQLVMYRYKFPGAVVCFIYVFFGALRLARFNIVSHNLKQTLYCSKFIEGLPTPAAAGVVVSIMLLFEVSLGPDISISKSHLTFLIALIPWLLNFFPAIILFLAFLMITKLKYPKVNNLRLTQRVSFKFFSIVLVLILLVFAYPETSVFLVFSMYLLYGLVEYLSRSYKIFKEKRISNDTK